jgi:hypothetical protein
VPLPASACVVNAERARECHRSAGSARRDISDTVLTTAVYSYFTWRMADEMKQTREQTLRPRLGLSVRPYDPIGGHVALRSLGPGTALNVVVTLKFEPSGETRDWRTPVFPSGDEAQFIFPRNEEGGIPNFKALEAGGVQVSVSGSMRDVAGRTHDVTEQLDVAAWYRVVGGADQVFVKTPMEEIASETKKIRQALERK